MTPYKDVTGRSGVDSYEIQESAILVRFKRNPEIYEYHYEEPGKETLRR
jgi:hypothetical protein